MQRTRVTRLRFDRGTLVFDGEPPRDLTRGCSVTWDERARIYRAPPWRYASLVQRSRATGLRLADGAARFSRLPASAWQPIPLRAYQREALQAWAQACCRGVCVLPTGAGKTRLAIAAIAACAASTLVLVPTRVLLHQWREELTRLFSSRVGVWGDGEHAPAQLMVATFESAFRHMAQWGNRFRLLVVDEAHHFGLSTRDEVLEMSMAPLRLGLTATPHEEATALHRIEHLIGPTVFQRSIGDLSGSYLADFDVIVHHIALEPEERRQYEQAYGVFLRYHRVFRNVAPRAPWRDFVAEANRSVEGRAALAAWRRSRRLIALTRGKARAVEQLLRRHRNNRVLVFTGDNAASYAIAERNLIPPITCDIKRAERDEVLERFRQGTVRAIVSSRVLNEGVDVPEADVAIIVGGVRGRREHVQRVGRLLRPRAGKRATVHELVAEGTAETRQAERRRLGLV